MKKLFSLIIISILLVFMASSIGMAKETIEMWTLHVDTNPPREVIDDAIERFENDHPDYEIDHVANENDQYKEKIKVAFSADNEPDIFMTWGSGTLRPYVEEGKVYELTDELEAGWEDRFLDSAMGLGEIDGEYYGVPMITMAPAVFWYRTDIFEEYGLEPPETHEEFIEIVETLKENGVTPIAFANKDQWPGLFYYMYYLDRIGGPEPFVEAANRENGTKFNDPEFIKAGQMLQDLVEMDAFNKGFNGMEYDSGEARMLIYSDKAAMDLMGYWEYAQFQKEDPETAENIDFFVFPGLKSGIGDSSNLLGTPGDNYFSVTEKSEHKEMAIEFLKYLSDEKAAEKQVEIGNIPPFEGVDEMLED
ncbi:MAG: ABC transporter substrate-binding protein, partial [Halanaerobiales bacterium]